MDDKGRERTERVVGELKGSEKGKAIVVTAAMHGNEVTGVTAASRVIDRIREAEIPFNGELLALTANLEALREDRRYIDADLNRIWTQDRIEKVKRTPMESIGIQEEKEMKTLLKTIGDFVQGYSADNVIIADLHNTSSNRGLFSITFDDPDCIRLSSSLRIPIITGLASALQRTAIEHYHDQGYTAFAFEGGRIGDYADEIHEAGIWLMLEACGAIRKNDIPNREHHQNILQEAADDFPALTELAYVHKLGNDDGFKMRPGYQNFQPVKRGECLAHDRKGEILAPEPGYMLMPLYQDQGEEGFFIIRDKKG